MDYNPKIHHRRSIRLRGYDYSQAGMYFVTLYIQDGRHLLGKVENGEMRLNAFGQIVADAWEWLAEHHDHVVLDAWVVMPNHLHGILLITDPDTDNLDMAPAKKSKPLGRLIGAFKTVSTRRINESCQTPGTKLWQRNYWEHIIRSELTLERIRIYIDNNPMRWGLESQHPA